MPAKELKLTQAEKNIIGRLLRKAVIDEQYHIEASVLARIGEVDARALLIKLNQPLPTIPKK